MLFTDDTIVPLRITIADLRRMLGSEFVEQAIAATEEAEKDGIGTLHFLAGYVGLRVRKLVASDPSDDLRAV